MNEEDDDRKDDELISDELRPEDGQFRYWMFVNGEQARLFAALIGVGCFIVWCYLYVMGLTSDVIDVAAKVLGTIAFVGWY